jgi:hypothetical protein
VAKLIEQKFGERYHISHVHRILGALGFSPQKPARVARERNDEAVAEFRSKRWRAIKKARREHRTIVLLDESGFMLQPLVRRTWAPRGETPVHRTWDRHHRLSVISALTVSPNRRRLGLYFSMHDANIKRLQSRQHRVEHRPPLHLAGAVQRFRLLQIVRQRRTVLRAIPSFRATRRTGSPSTSTLCRTTCT